MKVIDKETFNGFINLKHVTFNEGLETIGYAAFAIRRSKNKRL